jgi:hypothetical protein
MRAPIYSVVCLLLGLGFGAAYMITRDGLWMTVAAPFTAASVIIAALGPKKEK